MRGFLSVFLLALLTACNPSSEAQQPQSLPTSMLDIVTTGGKTISLTVQIADEPTEQATGLMWRKAMPENEGMLFIFPQARLQSFWMENTLIPLDMLFIDPQGRILHIHPNAVPHDQTAISSRFPVNQVLEINGGLAATWGIGVGDRIVVAEPVKFD